MSEEADPQPPPAPAGRSLADRIRGWASLVRLPVLAAAAVAVAVMLLVAPAPPIWPFVTTGRIYVESPQVYTRERLVNDRYRQDFWLKGQLEALDRSEHLIRERRFTSIGVGGSEVPGAEGGTEERGLVLPFQEEFLLRSAIRDKMRQMILENLLDDRHDLTGNSIYGLKFETAVIPGANTHAKPFVIVTIKVDPFQSDDGAGELEPLHFLASAAAAQVGEAGSRFDNAARQFQRWEQNLENRLNHYLEASRGLGQCRRPGDELVADAEKAAPDARILAADAGQLEGDPGKVDVGPPRLGVAAPGPDATPPPAAEAEHALIGKALLQVMGIDAREVSIGTWSEGAPFMRVDLPEPWNRFFVLRMRRPGVAEAAGGRAGATLELSPFFVNVFLVEAPDWPQYLGARGAEPNRYQAVRGVALEGEEGAPSTHTILVKTFAPAEAGDGAPRVPDQNDLMFARGLRQAELGALLGQGAPRQCLEPAGASPGAPDCQLTGWAYTVIASLYNFVKAIATIDAYSYAVFPRGDVEGVLSESALAARAMVPGAEEAGTGLGAMLRTETARSEPVVINFAAGHSGNNFDFGWAVVKPGRQAATQVSQLVLVSVPAYLDELELEVRTGWLDRNANPIPGGRPPVPMTVVLPPDYEALDTLVVGRSRRQGPVIDDTRFCEPIVVQACAEASILIPGERLWRSTTVTLGGQSADQITVMPDMRGIVASFDPVALPPAAMGGGTTTEEDLIVWTSEGSAKLPVPVEVRTRDAAGCAP